MLISPENPLRRRGGAERQRTRSAGLGFVPNTLPRPCIRSSQRAWVPQNRLGSRESLSGGPFPKVSRKHRHSGQAQRKPKSSLDSRPGLLPAGVTFVRGNDEASLVAQASSLQKSSTQYFTTNAAASCCHLVTLAPDSKQMLLATDNHHPTAQRGRCHQWLAHWIAPE
jgi:hypothetical protein